MEKLAILSDAAKYDASCASSGASGRNSLKSRGIGSTEGMGICHSYAPDGRCISLLKILLTNFCIYDCAYCINRSSSNVRRARFTVDEVVRLTIEFYKRNYIEGLFLSSGVVRSPDETMGEIVEVARRLREEEAFAGYIHLKTIPDCSQDLVDKAGNYADRLSINVELPTDESVMRFAPEKKPATIRISMARLRGKMEEMAEPTQRTGKRKRFAPAGQSTQMIVGADTTTDDGILKTSARLYGSYRLRRVYYSAFSPIPDFDLRPALGEAAPDPRAPALPGRLADAVLRFRATGNPCREFHGHARSRYRPEARLGAGQPPFLSTRREPRIEGKAAENSRIGHQIGHQDHREPALQAAAAGRRRTVVRIGGQGSAVHRRGRLVTGRHDRRGASARQAVATAEATFPVLDDERPRPQKAGQL